MRYELVEGTGPNSADRCDVAFDPRFIERLQRRYEDRESAAKGRATPEDDQER